MSRRCSHQLALVRHDGRANRALRQVILLLCRPPAPIWDRQPTNFLYYSNTIFVKKRPALHFLICNAANMLHTLSLYRITGWLFKDKIIGRAIICK